MIARDDIFVRNIAFWGSEQQDILAGKSVFIAGVGALGCVVAEILVRCGIGRVVVADRGVIDPPDLNRQALYTVGDLGEPKAYIAADRLNALTGLTEVVAMNVSIGEDDIAGALSGCDGVADCLDNFPSRFALEDALPEKIFMVTGALRGDYGQLTSIIPGRTVRLRELFAGFGKAEKIVPVIPTIVFAAGSLMAQEILNNLLCKPQLAGRILVVGMAGFYLEHVPVKPA